MPARQQRAPKAAGGRAEAALRERGGAAAAAGPPGPRVAPARAPSGVGCLWALLSSCLLAACSLGCLSPAWIVRAGGGGGGRRGALAAALESGAGGGAVSFGLLWHCPGAGRPPRDCYALGGLGRFGEIPSASWQTSAVLCSGGCALLAFSALLAVAVLFLPGGPCERRICTLACYIQTAAVFIMGFGLLVYPFGLSSATVRQYCEDSNIYYSGDCQIGWGYMLAIVGVMLSVFLPFFAKYAPKEHASPTPIPTIL